MISSFGEDEAGNLYLVDRNWRHLADQGRLERTPTRPGRPVGPRTALEAPADPPGPSASRRPARSHRVERRPRSSSSTRASSRAGRTCRTSSGRPSSRPSRTGSLRGRDLVAHGTGWVERIVVDEPETSTYFTPISITLNIDSFEHLEFETRPDQLLVYTPRPGRRAGDHRVRADDVADGRRGGPRRPAARVRHERLRPDGAPGPRRPTTRRPVGPATDADAESLDPALAPDVRDPERRRRAEPLPRRRPRPEDHDDDHEQVRAASRGRTSPTGPAGTGSRRRGSSRRPGCRG